MTVPKRTTRTLPDPELLKLADRLLANYRNPEDLIGENGLLKQLTKMLVERALETELTQHLGHDKNTAVTNDTGNARNGYSAKTLTGDFGELPLDIPLDRLYPILYLDCIHVKVRDAGAVRTTDVLVRDGPAFFA